MLSQHRAVFFDVAGRHTCWIGLREPNPLSDKWIGRPGGVPKAETCKAKTADNPTYPFAGLVVDPFRSPQAFRPTSLAGAKSAWQNKFVRGGQLPPGYTIIGDGPEAGLVKLRGSFLYADFDLMAVLRSDESGQFLTTSQPEQKRLFDAIKPALNRGLRAPMIQHPAEMMWREGVGGRAAEYVLWFGPGRRFNRWPSSMPQGGH